MTDTQPMTDTPVNPRTFPPPSKMEVAKAFIGDLARPFAIIATSLSAGIATVVLASRGGVELNGAGFFMGAVYAGVVGLYVGKAFENANVAKHQAQAQAEIAKATGASQ